MLERKLLLALLAVAALIFATPASANESESCPISPYDSDSCVYPAISMSADPATVVDGGWTNVNWSVSQAAYGCTSWSYPTSNFGIGSVWGSGSGTVAVGPLHSNTSLHIRCENYNGAIAEQYIVVSCCAAAPPPPTPPPPADSDRDGVPDERDNCPSDANAGQEDGDGDHIVDACDVDMPLLPGWFKTSEEQEGDYTIQPYPYAACRSKVQRFRYWFNQSGLFDVMRYEGMFRVCYEPGVRIAWIKDLHGDMVWTRLPWNWYGNDEGYPYAVNHRRYAEIHYRGSAAICLFSHGCGPQKHPWVKITFYPDNTMAVSSGVS